MGFNNTNKHFTTTSSFGPVTSFKKIIIQDQKSHLSSGGNFISGDWRTRDLNTTILDETGELVLSSNQFTLPAGDYVIHAFCPAGNGVGSNVARLQNITDASTEIVGSSGFAYTNSANTNGSFIKGEFTISSSKTFEIQHRCGATVSDGFGPTASINNSPEIYTHIELTKVA